MAFGLDDFTGFDPGLGNLGGGDAGGGGIGSLLSALLGLGGQAASGLGQVGSAIGTGFGDVGNILSSNPLAALQALSTLGGIGTNLFASSNQYQQPNQNNQLPPAQLPLQAPPLAGPYPRRGVPRADFQAAGLSGASPDFFDQMTNPAYQNPYNYSFQPQAQDPRQVYA